MHLYHWDSEKLATLLPPFLGGQCQVHNTLAKIVYRGRVREIITHRKTRTIHIIFDWLYERGVGKNEFDIAEVRWVSVPKPPSKLNELFLEFRYHTYYYQKKHDRLKLKSWGDSCRFYLPDDTDNIDKIDDEH
jgi:hypothetical protein